MTEPSPLPAAPAPTRIVAISLYTPAALELILPALASQPQPDGVEFWIGSYGINPADASVIAATPNAHYAPIFGVQPTGASGPRTARQLPPEQVALLSADYDGPIPADPGNPVLPRTHQRGWGIELGRRFRDELRNARGAGITVPNWQFDELLGTCGQPGEPSPTRLFIGGVLNGLAHGRPELADHHEQGLVWAAHSALTGLPTMAINPALTQFWVDLGAAARLLVGEEYPYFDGNPAHAAQAFSQPQRALLASGPIRRSLGNRYAVGLTPGWNVPGGLGGNIHNNPPAWVTNWRNQYMTHRHTLARAAGYAHFSFDNQNAEPDHINDAVASLHHALALIP